MSTITVNDSTTAAITTCAPLPTRESAHSARTMNRRDMLRLSLAAALMGTVTNPNEGQATQTVAAKPVSLPELPPEPPKDIAAKLFPGFVHTEVRTSYEQNNRSNYQTHRRNVREKIGQRDIANHESDSNSQLRRTGSLALRRRTAS